MAKNWSLKLGQYYLVAKTMYVIFIKYTQQFYGQNSNFWGKKKIKKGLVRKNGSEKLVGKNGKKIKKKNKIIIK